MKLKILHLSDLHFTEANIAQDIVTSSLSKKVQELCKKESKPNLLIISGDIAFSGKPEQYKKAKEFIDIIARHCELGNDRIFIIPGNHDVDRSKIKPEYIKWWYKFEDEKGLNLVLDSKDSFPKIKETTSAYFEFIKPYIDGRFTIGEYGEYVAEIPFANGLKIKIVGLNSAIFCGYDGDEQQHLALGLPQVSSCSEKVDPLTEIIISCIHHPFGCFHFCEKAPLNTVQRISDIILSGHVHDPSNSARREGSEGETIFIAAGAAYETRSSQNGFNIIEINSEDLKGQVIFYKYLPDKHTWILNKDLNPETDGVFDFEIKKNNYSNSKSAKENISVPISVPVDPIPKPPAFYAKPTYIGSHKFVGRVAELNTIDDWAIAANPYTILLFEAMGGSGKSILTWEWTTKRSSEIRKDWKGIFWYSFYEKGAVMADFCQRALAYITGKPLETFRKIKTPILADLLIPELNNGSWLIILDGLERVLEEYNNINFAEDAELKNTNIENTENKKDPCSCINDEDDNLLKILSSAAPSKILVSSRLVPRVLLNAAGQPIPGVQRLSLTGLRPADAELMFRSCGISGNSEAIQNYLATNCGCHPLTIGVLAGLINNYMKDRGNFDSWVNDPQGEGELNFANLDLVQKQSHILEVAMAKLSEKNRQLLSIMALTYEAIDYSTLVAFNPHIPAEPEEIDKPLKPEDSWRWDNLTKEEKLSCQDKYEKDLSKWKNYLQKIEYWKNSFEYINAPQKLEATVQDLEKRGLLQYDHQTKRYDLHPVVRRIASGRLKSDETITYGQKVVDYFSSKSHNPYEKAEAFEDISDGLHIVRTLLKMRYYQEAFDVYSDGLSNSLMINLEATNTIITLIRPFFANDWNEFSGKLTDYSKGYLLNQVAIALNNSDEIKKALVFYGKSILMYTSSSNLSALTPVLRNVSVNLMMQNQFPASLRILEMSLSLADLSNNQTDLFKYRCLKFYIFSTLGQWHKVEEMWKLLDPMGRNWTRNAYRPGDIEYDYAVYRFRKDDLDEAFILKVMDLAKKGNNRVTIRILYRLWGKWYMQKKGWLLAIEKFTEAVRLARTASITDSESETYLVLAKYNIGMLSEPVQEIERLSNLNNPAYLALAEIWLALGNLENAKENAIEAYNEAWALGEPYVHRYALNKAIALLNQLDEPIPQLPVYDPSKDEELPWEKNVLELIEKRKAEKEQKPD